MLTIGTRIKNIVFLIVGALAICYVGLNHADLGGYVGLKDYYVVKVDLPEAGGLAKNADVTYRGTSIGRVGGLDLTGDGVIADLRIRKSAPKVPRDTQAVVANRSAIGEQYIDLRPRTSAGPYLAAGSVIPRSSATTPAPVTDLLTSVNDLAASVPTGSLRTVVAELGRAFAGEGPNLQVLLDNSHALTEAADRNIEPTRSLIGDGQTVLTTQDEESGALKAFGRNARLLSRRLRASDPAFRKLVATAPGAAGEFQGLVRDLDPSMSVLIANFLTTSRVLQPRTDGLEQLLAKLPDAVSMGLTVARDGRLRFGMVNTFFDPPPCTSGYGGTRYRNGLDTSPGPALNTAARCTAPASSGINVRGSANAPHPPVPAAVRPGSVLGGAPAGSAANAALPGALALPGVAPGPSGMSALLGLNGGH
ncbi:MCE family protein [Actinomadura sp. LD22]|uniref:MCE family protein n=1 Tax=Actinomadura physcomitrii TaxID=2650748 RepID=A0A6I4MTC8_9ACTN|nr:MCE family protein [Actinomadura physcomitrii]MWA07147.1 MCE family protein [Actinomadura physcomitrii]